MKAYALGTLIMFLIGLIGGYCYWNRNELMMRFQGAEVKGLAYKRVEDSGMTVSFKTEKPVTSKVYYGTTELYGVETSWQGPSTEHSYYINGLLPGKENNFVVEIKTEDGKLFKTNNHTVPGEVK